MSAMGRFAEVSPKIEKQKRERGREYRKETILLSFIQSSLEFGAALCGISQSSVCE